MEHVVFHPGPDGAPAFRRVGSLEEAVSFVERLRNDHGVTQVTVHALTDVPVTFRPRYVVEVGVPAAVDPVVPAQAEPAEPVADVAEPVTEPAAEPVAEPVALVAEPAEPVAEPVADLGPEPEPEHVAEPEPVEATEFMPGEFVSAGVDHGRSLGFFAH